MIKRTNSNAFYIEKFIDDIKVGYEIEYYHTTARKQVKRFLENRADKKIARYHRDKLKTNMVYSGSKKKTSQSYKNKLKFVRQYNRDHYKHFSFAFSLEKDAELIEFLDTSKNKADLIRDMYENYKKSGLI